MAFLSWLVNKDLTSIKISEIISNCCIIIKESVIWKWYWLNNIDNINSVVSSGKLVKNKILLGCSGRTTAGCTGVGMTVKTKQEKLTINLLCPGKSYCYCMEQNPDLTIFSPTIFPVLRWKSSDRRIKFFPLQRYN